VSACFLPPPRRPLRAELPLPAVRVNGRAKERASEPWVDSDEIFGEVAAVGSGLSVAPLGDAFLLILGRPGLTAWDDDELARLLFRLRGEGASCCRM
jgi:hypothetical protein